MYKIKISFKNKKWICKRCGLIRHISKWKIKTRDLVYFIDSNFDKNYNHQNEAIYGTVIYRKNDFLIVRDNQNINEYYINQESVNLLDSPALFLYNMYGTCSCKL